MTLDFMSLFSGVREQIRQRHSKQFDLINRVETFCRGIPRPPHCLQSRSSSSDSGLPDVENFRGYHGAVILLESGMVSQDVLYSVWQPRP